MTTRIGIIGAGAVGCVVGGLLTKAGHDVTLIDQWPEHVETMKRDGLRLSGRCGNHRVAVRALHAQRFVDAAAGRGLAEVEADLTRDAKGRGRGRPSLLLQDVMRRRRTEVDYLNGYVVEQVARSTCPRPSTRRSSSCFTSTASDA